MENRKNGALVIQSECKEQQKKIKKQNPKKIRINMDSELYAKVISAQKLNIGWKRCSFDDRKRRMMSEAVLNATESKNQKICIK